VIADPHFDAATDERGGDVGLDVGKADHQVRFQPLDLVHLRTGERRHLRLLLARLRRSHGEAGDADDAVLFTEQVQRFGAFFGQADDALRKRITHVAMVPTIGRAAAKTRSLLNVGARRRAGAG
jgi:hypothetical protein